VQLSFHFIVFNIDDYVITCYIYSSTIFTDLSTNNSRDRIKRTYNLEYKTKSQSLPRFSIFTFEGLLDVEHIREENVPSPIRKLNISLIQFVSQFNVLSIIPSQKYYNIQKR
jgi:hypothetical protein